MFSNTGAYAYACSKGGELILAKMLAPELAKFHVRINCVCPGIFKLRRVTKRYDRHSHSI